MGVPPLATGSNQIGNLIFWSTRPPAPSSTFLARSSMRAGLLATGMVFRVDRDAMPGRLGQGARELVGIEVEDTDRIAAGDIDPAVDAVRRDVVNPPGGGNLRGGKNLVGLGRDVVGRSDWGET